MMATDMKVKLQAARLAAEQREKARQEREDQLELDAYELDEKLSAELGPRGVFYEIVMTVEGPVAVKLGDEVLYKQYMATAEKSSTEEQHKFVFPNVIHPDKESFLKLAQRRPGVLLRCANALATLYGLRREDEKGKF